MCEPIIHMGFLKFPHEGSLRMPVILIIEHLENGYVVCRSLNLIFGETINIILCVPDFAIVRNLAMTTIKPEFIT